jgi:SAM-dependent methyltransferase
VVAGFFDVDEALIMNTQQFDLELNNLGEFWERIDFPNGIKVGKARSKKLLWSEYLSKYFARSDLEGRSIIDLGCNAGGNLVELSKYGPSKLVGVEGADIYFRQAQFVVKEFGVDADVIKFRFDESVTPEDYEARFGRFDVIFCLGIIYHLMKETNLGFLRYMRRCGGRCILSTQTFAAEQRKLDWDVSREGTLALLREAGFSDVRDIHVKSEAEGWAALTNNWYFEALP